MMPVHPATSRQATAAWRSSRPTNKEEPCPPRASFRPSPLLWSSPQAEGPA